MKKNRRKQYIIVTHVIKKENDQYVATCPEFDVSSFGETVEEANENLKEAIKSLKKNQSRPIQANQNQLPMNINLKPAFYKKRALASSFMQLIICQIYPS